MENFDFGSLAGTAAGGGTVAVMAKFYLQRTLTQLDSVAKTMHSIKEELAGIAVKLEAIEKNDEIIRIHDRKIAKLEAKINGSYPPRFAEENRV